MAESTSTADTATMISSPTSSTPRTYSTSSSTTTTTTTTTSSSPPNPPGAAAAAAATKPTTSSLLQSLHPLPTPLPSPAPKFSLGDIVHIIGQGSSSREPSEIVDLGYKAAEKEYIYDVVPLYNPALRGLMLCRDWELRRARWRVGDLVGGQGKRVGILAVRFLAGRFWYRVLVRSDHDGDGDGDGGGVGVGAAGEEPGGEIEAAEDDRVRKWRAGVMEMEETGVMLLAEEEVVSLIHD